MKTKAEFKNGSWTQFKQSLTLRAGVLLLCLTAASSPAQTYTVLHSFTGADGMNPNGGLLLSDAMLYGTTTDYQGVANGTVFKISTNGSSFSVIKSFSGGSDGKWPQAGLVLSGTTLYGTTSDDGSYGVGTLFKMNTDGSGYTVLRSFTNNPHFDGYTPTGNLVSSGAMLYGTTFQGGVSNAGTVFKIDTIMGGYSLIKQFAGNDGRYPDGNLLLSGTTLYGTTSWGGTSDFGVVFKINTDGSGFSVLKRFQGSDGSHPGAGLVLLDMTLYGITAAGGFGFSGDPYSGYGTVFKVNTDGSGYTVVKSFNDPDVANPGTGLTLSGTTLYGTTSDTVFQIDIDGSGFAPIKKFLKADGLSLNGPLLLSDNILYGTTGRGGISNLGVMFRLSPGPPTEVINPGNQTIRQGGGVEFRAVATGWPPPDYQWFFDGTNAISGATTSVVQLTNIQPFQSGFYIAVATNLYGSVTSSPARLDVIAPGDTTVRSCTEQALRVALTEGNRVTFACDGTITLGNKIVIGTNTVLDGSGHQIIISGGNLVQVFQVNTNVSLALINLTIANGLSTNGYGGGIYNGGTVNAMNCHFIANQAQGAWGGYYGLPGKDGCGGAVYNSGTLNIIDCSFAWNSARGGKGGFGDNSMGAPPSGSGGVGGAGNGGAIYNLGLLAIKGSTFTSNSTVGGTGGLGGDGATSLYYPIDGGAGGMGGDGNGSILFNSGSASLINSTFALNSGIGGTAGQGGGGSRPGVPGYPGGNGGPGGMGGSSFGAICDTNGHIYLINCTLAFNSGTRGSGGPGGSPGSTAFGGLKISGGQLVNTLLATTPPGSNCLGKITDAGHNLSSDGSCAFTNIGSRNNVDPKLSPLANNGGPTLTMALLPGSPAIDAGDNASAPPTDQRGVVRPSGVACDIGAYECSPPSLTIPPPTQTAEIGTTIEFTAQASTFTPATYQWFFNGNAINGCTNSVLCLSGVQITNIGAYTVVVSNVDGVVTSSPAMLNVIPVVERRPVPGVKVTGEVGSLLNVEYASSLSRSPNWTTLGSVSLTSTSQFCPDLTMPLPPERFYRAWQTGTPGVVPSLNLNFVPAIMLTGKVGDSLHLDCINAIGPTNDWVTLATVTLTNTPQLYFDVSAPGQPARLYRIVPVP